MSGCGLLRRFLLASGIVCTAVAGFAQAPKLQLSSSALVFPCVANGPAPPAQLLTALAADGSFVDVKPLVDGGTAGSPAPSWLTVTPSLATTPAEIRVSVDPTGLAPGMFSARIQLTDRQGQSLSAPVPVSVQVTTGSPQLDVSPAVVKLSGAIEQGNLQQEVLVRNTGPGAIAPVSVTIESGYPWLSAVVAPCDSVCAISVRAGIATLTPGTHNGLLRIKSAQGTQDVPVSLFAADHGPFLQLSAAGVQFYGEEDSGLVDTRTISVRNLGDSPAAWTASVVDGQQWLSVSPATGVTAAQGTTDLTITMNEGIMGARTYGGLIRISSKDGSFGSLDVPIILRLDSLGSPAAPLLSMGGLVFQLPSGAEGIQLPLTLAVASPNSINYQASQESASWLSVSPTRGQVAALTPAPLSVVAASIGLQPGFYSGRITFSVGTQSVRTLNAGFSVTGAGVSTCQPQLLYLTQTGIPDNFATRTGFPTPLAAVLVDDCGNFISNALVSATFSNSDPGIGLEPIGNGHYIGTWIPAQASDSLPGGAVNVSLRAFAPPLPSAATDVIGAVASDIAPATNTGGVVNNLNAQSGAPVAPGAIVQIYGSEFGTAITPGTITDGHLSTTLGGVSVAIGGTDAPLYYSSTGQINAQVPVELSANQQYQVVVKVNGLYSNPETINTAAAQPGLAVLADNSVIAQDVNYNLITANHPAHAGDVIILYLTGMGATNPLVPSGVPAPSSPLAQAVIQPQVTIDGSPAQVLFAGLSPGSVGLYQIDVKIPAGARTGDLPLVVKQGSVASNTAILGVR
jgi:uncharacterized protein (TIGR03437 family)